MCKPAKLSKRGHMAIHIHFEDMLTMLLAVIAGCCCAVRASAINAKTLTYVNNIEVTTGLGHNFTYVFTT